MISNRMRIESSIEKARKTLRSQRPFRGRMNSRSETEIYKLSQEAAAAAQGSNSDAGSGDELIFLTRRRVSMPDGGSPRQIEEDTEHLQEQHRRRKFMAQFNDSHLGPASQNSSKASILFDSDDSEAHTTATPPSSPEFIP